jgi:hypothetical protein
LNNGEASTTEDATTRSKSRSRSRSNMKELLPRRKKSMTRVSIALDSAQGKEARALNNKGKAPMLDATELGSNSCEEDETLTPSDEIDDDADVQMEKPMEISIQEGMTYASSNKGK